MDEIRFFVTVAILIVGVLVFSYLLFRFFALSKRRSSSQSSLASGNRESEILDLENTLKLLQQERKKSLMLAATGLICIPLSLLLLSLPQQMQQASKPTLFDSIQKLGDTPASLDPTEDEDGDEEEPWFVMIRSKATDKSTFYIPVDFASSGIPSHLILENLEQVSYINLAETPFGVLNPPDIGTKFCIEGLIDEPGEFEVLEDAETLADLASPSYAKSYSVDSNGPNMIVVKRKTDLTGVFEYYLIPLKEPFLDDYLFDSYIQADDVFSFVRVTDISNVESLLGK